MKDVSKMAYIVFYRGKAVEKKIDKMPVNLAYVSKRINYLVFYGDMDKEKTYFNHLKNVKGFQKIEASPLYNEDVNYDLENKNTEITPL